MLFRLAAVLCLLWTGFANAQSIKPGQLTAHATGSSWVLGSSGVKADIDFDFSEGRYYGCATLSDCLTVSRASSGTNLRPTSAAGASYSTFAANVLRITAGKGLLVEEARTNQLLNSTVPATQTTGSLNTGAYTLWVNGTGSAIASAGTATISGEAAATNGSPNTFTVTGAGTVTITVTGSLNAFQLEAGTFGTSLIVTAGTTATRAADVPSLTGVALTAALNAKAAFFQTTGVAGTTVANRLFQFDGGALAFWASSTTVTLQNGVPNTTTATVGSGTYSGLQRIALGFDDTSMTAKVSGGSLATAANAWSGNTGNYYLANNNTGIRALNGYMQRFALSTTKGLFDGLTSP